jgi:hypothetical protein
MGLLSSFINEMIFLQEHKFVSKSDKRKFEKGKKN